MRVCIRCKKQVEGALFDDIAICEDCLKKVKPFTCVGCGKKLEMTSQSFGNNYGICKSCRKNAFWNNLSATTDENLKKGEEYWDREYKKALIREGKLDPESLDQDSDDSESSALKTYPTTSSSTSSSSSSSGFGCSKGVIKFFAVLALIALISGLVIGFVKNGGLKIGFSGAIKFMKASMNPPKEYYGVSVEGQDNGWVAAFKLDNAGSIFCGEDPEMGEYYIIGSTLYLAGSDGQWEARSYGADTERLLSRHLHTVLDGQYTYKSGEARADGGGMTHTFDNDHSGGVISVSSDGKITMYAARLDGNCAFDLKDTDFAQLKKTAMQILEG